MQKVKGMKSKKQHAFSGAEDWGEATVCRKILKDEAKIVISCDITVSMFSGQWIMTYLSCKIFIPDHPGHMKNHHLRGPSSQSYG